MGASCTFEGLSSKRLLSTPLERVFLYAGANKKCARWTSLDTFILEASGQYWHAHEINAFSAFARSALARRSAFGRCCFVSTCSKDRGDYWTGPSQHCHKQNNCLLQFPPFPYRSKLEQKVPNSVDRNPTLIVSVSNWCLINAVWEWRRFSKCSQHRMYWILVQTYHTITQHALASSWSNLTCIVSRTSSSTVLSVTFPQVEHTSLYRGSHPFSILERRKVPS